MVLDQPPGTRLPAVFLAPHSQEYQSGRGLRLGDPITEKGNEVGDAQTLVVDRPPAPEGSALDLR